MHPLISALIDESEAPCVTVSLPVLPGVSNAHENISRLNRLLDGVEPHLEPYGIGGKARGQFCAPARAYGDQKLSAGVGEGTVMLFLSPSSFHAQHVPEILPERVTVGDRFYVTPILPHIDGSLHYYILAVSRNHAHFLEVKDGELEALNIPGMPGSLAEAWAGTEHTDESLQSHSAGNGHAMFHGQANAKDDKEMEVTTYLRKISKSLHPFLEEHRLPMVFAGVDELHGIYSKLPSTSRMLSEFVRGNPDHMEAEELLGHADPIVQEAANRRKATMLESYHAIAGTGRTSNELNDVLDAAAAGKVDTLFLSTGAEQWGVFDMNTGKKTLHEAPEPGNEELLGLAATLALRHRGQVAVLSPDMMPEGKQVAAILRL